MPFQDVRIMRQRYRPLPEAPVRFFAQVSRGFFGEARCIPLNSCTHKGK